MIKKYNGLPRYILETTHGCYSDYGWTIAATFQDIEMAEEAYNHWIKTGQYRLIENGLKVLMAEEWTEEAMQDGRGNDGLQ